MDRFPVILWLGAGLLGWVGAEMMITDPILETYLARVSLALGDYTHLAYKLAGFVAVIFAVIGVQHLKRGRA
jgi:predicted tellurium resistance membrane protein TerC